MLKKPVTETVFCVASGPSLTREDCQLIQKTGCSIIAVNNTWKLFDDIYALYAGDLAWWKQYRKQVPNGQFRKVTGNLAAAKSYALEYRRYCGQQEGFNSGAMAISFARELGAKVIVLVGYDCSLAHGVHWHGQHSGNLRNPTGRSISRWHQQFQQIRERHPKLQILNASRRSDLKCFPRISLDAVTAQLSLAVVPAP
ncbi:norphogenetic protein [Salmonella enterica]|nr:norphogenetic protein [Salmonella enterica]EHK5999330.1 norphogenetic protein [Salmonella enterica]EIF5124549.1 norphogenetic protein [Salmonella enterica]EIF5348725.1 norphogenetic protein [Salmonella enterica]EIF5657322.1 norphogenetic protein [Salmonella enterica]